MVPRRCWAIVVAHVATSLSLGTRWSCVSVGWFMFLGTKDFVSGGERQAGGGGLGHVWFPRGCGGMVLVVTVGGEGGGSWVGCSRGVLVLLVRCWGAGWSYGMGCVFMWEEFSLQITLAYIVIVLCIGLASRPGGWWFSW
ncbi:hypothetical protein F5148DRAFT_196919 [Russula earlei]|uniref:Uncharacterized protein n=1 Tax=Russula earlei TaxID=71964 RepID=A0ACC0U6B4_9AGAM|nr:hypothetical protein F5148DRAFT_196919 [Russula earlei]